MLLLGCAVGDSSRIGRVTRRWCGRFYERSPSVLRLTALNQDKTQFGNLAHDLGMQLLIAHVVKLARTANLAALDAFAGKHALFLDRRHRSVQLAAVHRTRAYLFGLFHEAFGGYNGGGRCRTFNFLYPNLNLWMFR